MLAPTLRPGDVVILDNLAVHKHPAVRDAIEAVGAQLRFLPPYSPDFIPIEKAFAKLKAFLRAARPRTFDQVCDLLAAALALYLPEECRNHVRHCGYALPTNKKGALKWAPSSSLEIVLKSNRNGPKGADKDRCRANRYNKKPRVSAGFLVN